MTVRWTDGLEDEDLVFLKRFLLASGSLKELARLYGISYPTVRLRLDRLIEKVKLTDAAEPMSDFELALRALHVDGVLDQHAVKKLLALHQKSLEEHHDTLPIDRHKRSGLGK
jgi:hypothetical protein